MTDEAKQDVLEQDPVAPAEASDSDAKAASEPKQPEQPKETSKDYNWRAMEQKLAELERKNQELVSKSQDLPDEFASLQGDDLITKEQLEKIADRIAEKKAKHIVDTTLAERERQALPLKTKQKFEDYDQVVTNENIDKLVREDPDLEFDIQHSKNPWERAYREIKKANFFKEQQASKPNADRINANSQKPVNSAALNSKNPLDKANAFATWSKDELYKEMMSAAKLAGNVPRL